MQLNQNIPVLTENVVIKIVHQENKKKFWIERLASEPAG